MIEFILIKPTCKREHAAHLAKLWIGGFKIIQFRGNYSLESMTDKLIPVAKFNKTFNQYLPYTFDCENIYQSEGLEKHITKRHPECLPYLDCIASIVSDPDYIGVNPRETEASFELVKVLAENIIESQRSERLPTHSKEYLR